MPFKHLNTRHRKSRKKKYRVKNWVEYNKALINRSGIIFARIRSQRGNKAIRPIQLPPKGTGI